ncbi:MAG: tyrosine-type recombinase/integrase [Myxococcales bacterium]|nr:tyrosine-type recombinase/integrase [Myxococcales bacterium]
MSALAETATEYLRLRRLLGHNLDDHHRLLPRFVAYLDSIGAATVTIEAAVAWATDGIDPATTNGARRMMVARGFARHMAGVDEHTEIPPAGLVPMQQRWRPPFLFSATDISVLMGAAGSRRWRLPSATYTTLIGLLTATGMRVGEALRLEPDDINHLDNVIVVRQSKFGKSRLVPVRPETIAALDAYLASRDGLLRVERDTSRVFVSSRGGPLIYPVVQQVFRELCDRNGIGTDAPRAPRIHDLRHTFAVTVLTGWYRNGENIEARLPALSTYLGHRDPRSTYWYLSAAPELLAYAAAKLTHLTPAPVREVAP